MYEPRPVRGKNRRGLAESSLMPTKNHAILQQECTYEAIPSKRLVLSVRKFIFIKEKIIILHFKSY